MKNFVKQKAIQGIGQARALLYTLESLPLPLLNRLITGEQNRTITKAEQDLIVAKVQKLLDIDSRDFVDLDLPMTLLTPEAPLDHVPRYLQVLGDSTFSFWRRRNKQTTKFSKKVKNLNRFPKYYQRNFHHQTDGYLSDDSAKIYEHQVELLFRGLADPMRRRILKPMIKNLKNKKHPKILEIACGAGTFTKALAHCFPHAEITAIDLSPNYVKHSRKRFIDHPNVNFMVANAEDLPFKDESFDAVVSVYLHHELPQKVREQVIDESLRVCKAKGFWGLVDSIQLGDDPELDWAIQEFPKTFHEPFFTNYIKNQMFDYVKENHPDRQFNEKSFLLSKVLYGA